LWSLRGSAADVMARLIGQKLSERIGQPVIAENRAGASGIIGADVIAKGAPDGYMLGIATSTTHCHAPIFNAKLPFDPIQRLRPGCAGRHVALRAGRQPDAAREDRRLRDRARQGQAEDVSYSSVGQASQAYLADGAFSPRPGAEFNHIPYKSSTHAVIDLVEGRIDMQFGISAPAWSSSGRQAARAGARRDSAAKTCPTCRPMAEAGVPDFERRSCSP